MTDKPERNLYRYIFFFGILLLWVISVLYIIPKPAKKEIIVTISEQPLYGKYTTKGRNRKLVHFVKFRFNEFAESFLISGPNYQYLNHINLKKDIHAGSKIKIVYSDNEISELYKDEKSYIDKVPQNIQHQSELKIINTLLIVGLLSCIIILFSKKYLSTHTYLKILKFSGVIIIFILGITFFMMKLYLKFKVADEDWTKYPDNYN